MLCDIVEMTYKMTDTVGDSVAMETCRMEGCENPIKVRSRGLCNKHYRRFQRHGDPSIFVGSGKKPTPVPTDRKCVVCMKPLVQRRDSKGRLAEEPKQFMKRRTCSVECGRVSRHRTIFDASPHLPGSRTILARSCVECGHLLAMSAFMAGRGWTCSACRNQHRTPEQRERYRQRVETLRQELQAESMESATRYGQQWTGPELELIVTRTDLTRQELALMLGRSLAAIGAARARAMHEPKWQQVAGV